MSNIDKCQSIKISTEPLLTYYYKVVVLRYANNYNHITSSNCWDVNVNIKPVRTY